jgi:hypothetical protein
LPTKPGHGCHGLLLGHVLFLVASRCSSSPTAHQQQQQPRWESGIGLVTSHGGGGQQAFRVQVRFSVSQFLVPLLLLAPSKTQQFRSCHGSKSSCFTCNATICVYPVKIVSEKLSRLLEGFFFNKLSSRKEDGFMMECHILQYYT